MRQVTALVQSIYNEAKDHTFHKYDNQFNNATIFDNDPRFYTWDTADKTALVRYKQVPFTVFIVPTEWYNATVLLLMTLVTLAISRTLLSSWAQDQFKAIFAWIGDQISRIRGKVWILRR
jgi:hypothetical protein